MVETGIPVSVWETEAPATIVTAVDVIGRRRQAEERAARG